MHAKSVHRTQVGENALVPGEEFPIWGPGQDPLKGASTSMGTYMAKNVQTYV